MLPEQAPCCRECIHIPRSQSAQRARRYQRSANGKQLLCHVRRQPEDGETSQSNQWLAMRPWRLPTREYVNLLSAISHTVWPCRFQATDSTRLRSCCERETGPVESAGAQPSRDLTMRTVAHFPHYIRLCAFPILPPNPACGTFWQGHQRAASKGLPRRDAGDRWR